MVGEGDRPSTSLSEALGLTTLMQGHWLPDGDAEWRAYFRVTGLLSSVMDEMPEEAFDGFLAFDGSWVRWEERLAAASGGLRPDDCAGLLRDHARALVEDVIRPTLHMARYRGGTLDEGKVAWCLLNSGRSLRRCVEEAVSWKTRETTLGGLMASLRRGKARVAEWPACLPDHVRDGLSLKVLTTERQLVDEGRSGTNRDGSKGLGHCVGGYARPCQGGTSRIVSIRREVAGRIERVATCEVGWKVDGPYVRQTRGKNNAVAPPEVRDALNAYVADLRAGLLGPVPRHPEPTEGYSSFQDDETSRFDPELDRNWEVVMGAWNPVVGRFEFASLCPLA